MFLVSVDSEHITRSVEMDISYITSYNLVLLNTGNPDDIYWYAQTLYLTGQYHRASQLLRTRKLDKVML